MKILITGVAGFVGSSIAKLFNADGHEIHGIDNFSRVGSYHNRAILMKLGINVYFGDIRNQSDLNFNIKFDWVIDAAAIPSVMAGVDGQFSSRQLLESNLNGTINILEFCAKNGSGLILLSTSRVYSISELIDLKYTTDNNAFKLNSFGHGFSPDGISEKFSTQSPISLYGSTKLSSELIAQEYGLAYNFPVIINRCGVLAGGGQFGKPDQGIFSYWVYSWYLKKKLRYIGFNASGYQVRDCLHPYDLKNLLTLQMASPSYEIYNVGGGLNNSISLYNLSNWCSNNIHEHFVDLDFSERKFDIPYMIMDNSKVNRDYGWEPKFGINDILFEIFEFIQKNPSWLSISN